MLGWLLFVLVLAPAFGQLVVLRQRPGERQKIDSLIATVAGLHDAVLIRKRAIYDASQAAQLCRTWRLTGARVHTADGFITCCFTRLSVSGIHDKTRFAHSSTVDAATLLWGRRRPTKSTAQSGPR